MPVVPPILPALDAIRGIGGILGLRSFKVVVRKRVWQYGRPGAPGAVKTDTDVVLTNQDANGVLQPVRVRQLTRSEVFSSGGQYASRDLRVGPMTPTFLANAFSAAAGFDDTALNPVPSGSPVELIWIVSSPTGTHGIPPSGIICELKGEEATSLHYYGILRSTGRAPT
jgi:hypothetical protein